VNLREVLNAIFYVLATGCQWQALPKDLPPKSAAHHYFASWDWDGALGRIHEALCVATREAAGRQASPTAAIIDSQSAKTRSKRGAALDPQGFDASKKVTGRKRHILVDTLGDLGHLGCCVAGAIELTRGHRVDRVLPGKQPDSLPRDAPPVAQKLQQLRREHRVTVLAALALLDAEHHALAVNIRNFQRNDLGDAQVCLL